MHSAEALLAQANAGDPDAEYALALRYRDGSWAVTKNQQESSAWLRRSAAAGNPFAVKTLTKSRLGQTAVPAATGGSEHL
jgi:TPR repeat protein